MIAEFGWPSAGYNFHDANPGRIDQAVILRDFVTRAEAYGIDYNIVEAIDQPWKTMEGGVGPYWGIFDAAREPKFSWTGPITDPDYIKSAGFAVLLGLLLSLPVLAMAGATATQAALLAISANVVGAWFAAIVAFWKGHYFVPGAAFAFGFGIILLLPLIAIALSRLDEIAAIAFGRPPRRLAGSAAARARSVRAKSVDPYPGMLRAAGHDQGDTRCRRAPRLSQRRMRGGDQQHARSGLVAAGRRALPRARRALQIRQCRKARRLQGRCAARGARPYGGRRGNHRQHRRRLRRRCRTG